MPRSVPFLIMGRVTYIHHYLPSAYFSVIMLGLVLDSMVFRSRMLSERARWVVFIALASAIIGTGWWFRAVAWGIAGPIAEHKGLLWRKVSSWYDVIERAVLTRPLQTWNIYTPD